MSLSVVISAYNNQDVIEDCLKSAQGLADEIIVVDNESTDATVAIAKKFSAKIFSHKNNPLVLNQAKNFGFTKTSSDWILSLDTDERVSPELASQIQKVTSGFALVANGYVAYQMPRKNIIFGKWIQHGLWYPDYQIRLFQRGKAKFPLKHNHEKLSVAGSIADLNGHLVHYNYTSVTQYMDKINHVYSDNEVNNFLESGKKISWHDAIRMPAADFLTNFFAREGYKDGLHGLALSLMQAFYTFIVFAKIWEKQSFFEFNQPHFAKAAAHEFHLKAKEFRYWVGQTSPNLLRQILIALRLRRP